MEKDLLRYYEVYPKIVLANKETQINIVPKARPEFNGEYIVKIYSMDEREVREFKIESKNGNIQINHFFKGEQEHRIDIFLEDPKIKKCEQAVLHLYSLNKDLFELRPYKGDFHMHSTGSDGLEVPEGNCAYARKKGLDFIAITDHTRYEPSNKAIAFCNECGTGLTAFNGEEVHCHGFQYQHILAFGHKAGLGEKYLEDKNLFQKELEKYMIDNEEEINSIPTDIDKIEYASYKMVIGKIRKAGGIGMLVHPFWVPGRGFMYHRFNSTFKYMYENNMFDAFELLNGGNRGTNSLQIGYYQQNRAEGNVMPIISGSDSHYSAFKPEFSKLFTVVFSKNIEVESVINAVKNHKTVVVNKMDEENSQIFGDFRLLKFTHYLIRQIFPMHDEICSEEGRNMLEYFRGNNNRSENIISLKKEVEELYSKIWSKD